MLEAEKGKAHAEAEKRVLEERVWEAGKTLMSAAEDKLRKAEVHKRLLEKKAQSYEDDVEETQWKIKMEQEQLERATSVIEALEGKLVEARRAKEKMDEVVKGLKEELARK